MIFSILIIILVAAIAFYHYTQGFFSAAISALLAVIAAVLAMSWQEVIVHDWLQGRMADEANAIALIVVFAVVYVVLRFIFDAAVPGNVRLPVLVDKLGAAVMGVIAGICVGGIIAVAAQTLPLGPSIAGYTRFPVTAERNVIMSLPRYIQQQTLPVHDALKNPKFEVADQQGMILPADDWLVEFVSYLSQPTSSLAGQRTVQSVHPHWLNQLFADRLGIEVGGKSVAFNLARQKQVQVSGVFDPASLPETSGEVKAIEPVTKGVAKSDQRDVLLVLRVIFSRDATDSDNLFRFSMGASQLIANGHVYYGIGTVDNARILVTTRIDDPLFVSISGNDKGADIAFMVPRSEVLAPEKKGQPARIAQGVFLQVKRLGRVDLSGKQLDATLTPDANIDVLRKTDVQQRIRKSVPTVKGPLTFQDIQQSDQLFVALNTGTPDKDIRDQQLDGGTISLKDGKFSGMNLKPTDTIVKMEQGGYTVRSLYAPPGKSVVQIVARPSGEDGWKWADVLGQFTLVDSNAQKYEPVGAIAQIQDPMGRQTLYARYTPNSPLSSLPAAEGRPISIWVIYLVPSGTNLKQWDFTGKFMHDLSGQ